MLIAWRLASALTVAAALAGGAASPSLAAAATPSSQQYQGFPGAPDAPGDIAMATPTGGSAASRTAHRGPGSSAAGGAVLPLRGAAPSAGTSAVWGTHFVIDPTLARAVTFAAPVAPTTPVLVLTAGSKISRRQLIAHGLTLSFVATRGGKGRLVVSGKGLKLVGTATLRPGATSHLTVKLRRNQRALIAKLKQLRLRITVTAPDGSATVLSNTVRLVD
jgi:hypothetical protein